MTSREELATVIMMIAFVVFCCVVVWRNEVNASKAPTSAIETTQEDFSTERSQEPDLSQSVAGTYGRATSSAPPAPRRPRQNIQLGDVQRPMQPAHPESQPTDQVAIRLPIPRFPNGRMVASNQVIHVIYQDRHNKVTARAIEPHSVQVHVDKGSSTVVMIMAYCRSVADWRTFRPDRMRAMVSPTGEVLSDPQRVFAPAVSATRQPSSPPTKIQFSLRNEQGLSNGITSSRDDDQVEEA